MTDRGKAWKVWVGKSQGCATPEPDTR